jgi:peptidoglycan/LPS O-acetylase OafA/YrhL
VLLAIVTNAPLKNGLDRFTFGTLPAHLLLVHAWGPFVDGAGEWNPPSWSVSIEAFAYLVFPFLMWLSARKSLSNPWLQIIAMVALGTALNAITPWGLYGFPGLARGVSEFALGCVAAGLFASPFAKWCQSSLASTICVLVLLAAFAITPATSFLIGVATVPLLFALAGSNPAARVVGSKPIYFLGEISYSIYLGHFLFSSISYRIISIEWMKTGIVPLSVGLAFIFAFVLVLSTICYYTIEKPGRNLLRRQKTTRRTVAANADVRAET